MPLQLKRLLTPRFSIKSLLVLMLGVAIGYSLNLYTLRVVLGPGSESTMMSLPTYVIEPPDVVTIDLIGDSLATRLIEGEHLVGPDGRISLGELGSIYLAGLTLEEGREAIEHKLAASGRPAQVVLDVMTYNSKKYYVITKGKPFGDNIVSLPVTGNDTVLDALATMGGVKSLDTKIYISRPSAKPNGAAKVLPVNYGEVVQGVTRTNYQLLPGDRLFIEPAKNATPITGTAAPQVVTPPSPAYESPYYQQLRTS